MTDSDEVGKDQILDQLKKEAIRSLARRILTMVSGALGMHVILTPEQWSLWSSMTAEILVAVGFFVWSQLWSLLKILKDEKLKAWYRKLLNEQ